MTGTAELLQNYDGDVYLYMGEINREGYDKLSKCFEAKEQKKAKSCLILITFGGDPDAAYRIARAANHHYKHFEVLIPDICKSAGTLICIGAKNLIFGDRGELGPLDIQISKPDEMFESVSGLNIIQAISALENQILESFRTYLVDIRGGSRIRTKMAADIATKLTEAFISPISAKIDPVTLGEHQRAMQIGFDYGERLNNLADSLNPNALLTLVSGYPSHGFVIDRKEAATLFKKVSCPDETTTGLYLWGRNVVENIQFQDSPQVLDMEEVANAEANHNKELEREKHEDETLDDQQSEANDTSADVSAANESEGDKPDSIKSTEQDLG